MSGGPGRGRLGRRRAVQLGGATLLGGLAGCGGLFQTRRVGVPPVVEDPPDAVYYPSHVEGMQMVGAAEAGDRTVGVTYSYPHRFWTVTGTETARVDVGDDDGIHLMATVWDTETGTVLPMATGVRFEVRHGGSAVDERRPWPMLSQNMGFHFGDNVGLDGDGTYAVTVSLPAAPLERRGSFAGRFDEAATATLEFEFDRATLREIPIERLDERKGERGAVEPMEMERLPLSRAPKRDALPGRRLGEATADGGVYVATVLPEGDGSYLAVSPRTPYNRYVLPLLSLAGRLDVDGRAAFEGPLSRAIGPDLGYHYGARVDAAPQTVLDGTLEVSVEAPPQVSRHEGYETAFLGTPTITVG